MSGLKPIRKGKACRKRSDINTTVQTDDGTKIGVSAMMREKATGNLEHTPESRQIQTNYLKIDMTVTFDKQWGRNRKNVSKHMVFKRQIT